MILKVRRTFGAYVGGGVPDAPPYTNGIFFYPAGRPEAVPYIMNLLNYLFCFPSAERLADLSLSMLLPKTKKR